MNPERVDQTEARSNGLGVSAGDKRPPDDFELSVASPKKARIEDVLPRSIKNVAEIVLVLATLGNIRAGRSPTPAEMEMMAQARAELVDLCQGFAPKDVFPREVFGSLIEDLGLTKLREEERVGFRPTKMSIAEKLLVTKHQMEKSSQVPMHSTAPCSSPQTQMNLPESHQTANAGRSFHLNGPKITTGLQPASSFGQVSTVKTASLPYQLPKSEVRPAISTGLPTRVDGSQFRLDGRSNGSSFTPQIQAYSSGDHTTVKTPTWSVHPQPSQYVKFGTENKITTQTSQPTTSKPFITQSTPRNVNLQGVKQGTFHNSHSEIGKVIKKILQPTIPVYPAWTPPSRDYMNKSLGCQICKIIISEISSVLVCDGCEKGYHLKCLQNNNQKPIPRGEWHCPKCLSLNSGKPLPPKYGRVMRNTPASTKSTVNSDKKVSHLSTTTANGLMIGSLASGDNLDDKPPGMSPNNSQEPRNTESNNQTAVPESAEVQLEPHLVEESEKSFGGDTLDHNPNHENKVVEQTKPIEDFGSCINPNKQARFIEESVHSSGEETRNSVPNHETKPLETSGSCTNPNMQATLVKDSMGSFVGETLVSNPNHETKLDEQGSEHINPVETSGTCIMPNVQASFVEESAKSSGGETLNNSSNCETKVEELGSPKTKPLETSGTYISANEHASSAEEPNKSFGGETVNSNPNTQTNVVENSRNCIAETKFETSMCANEEASLDEENANPNPILETKAVDERGSIQADTVEISKTSEGLNSVEWTGGVINVVDEKTYYQSCCINGVVYNVQDHALLIFDNKLLPSKLQTMWEDSITRFKWVEVNRCYFPEDLPEGVLHPFPIENNEVYESNLACTVMAGYIQGPCKVIHPSKLTEESETGTELEIDEGDQPPFLCKWLYDESKGLFRSIST